MGSTSRNRKQEVKVRLTDEERIQIKKKAFASGLQEAVFMREASLNSQIIAPLTIDQMKQIRSLSSISNNLNQVVKEFHRNGLTSVATELENILTQIKRIVT
jgi:predicted DNA binding CopG/RHH family protein